MDLVEPTPEPYPMPTPMPEPSLEMISLLWLGIFLFVSLIILTVSIIAIVLLVKKKTLGCCLLGVFAFFLMIFNVFAFYMTIKPLVVDQSGWDWNTDDYYDGVPDDLSNGITFDEFNEKYDDYDYYDEASSTPPSETVENFLYSSLGTLANSNLDQAKAQKLLAHNLATEFDDPMFFQKHMCIQDGPSKIQVGSSSDWGTAAQITVEAQFGSDPFEPFWDFYLVQINGKWQISQIICLKN